MKIRIYRWFIIAGLWLLSASLPVKAASPVEYMSSLMVPLEKTKDDTWNYLKAVTRGRGGRKVESARQDLLAQLKSSKFEVKKKAAYESDVSLRDAVVNYLELSYIVLKEDFDKILDMEDIAEQSYDLMEAYLLAKEKANDKLSSAFDSVVTVQAAFAEKYGITLLAAEKDKTSEKIRKASESLSYYNQVYLIFFKCYKQEAYVLDAMQRNDITALAQNTATFVQYCDESLTKAKSLESYRGDAILKTAVQRILHFYQREAEEDFPAISDFYVKKDNFEKIQKAFESKSKNERTQEDVNRMNTARQEYNTSVNKVNQIMNASNDSRNRELKSWNEQVENFFTTHSK